MFYFTFFNCSLFWILRGFRRSDFIPKKKPDQVKPYLIHICLQLTVLYVAYFWQMTTLFFLYSSANQGRRCPKLTGVGASTVFTRYCWEYFNLPIEPIPLQLDCKASELHCFPHLGTDQRPPQSNLEVLVKLCTNFSPVQLYDVGNYRLGCTLTGWE